MYKGFETMGVVLDKEQEAEELISFVKEKVAKLEEVTSEIPESDKPRVYFATRIHGGGGTQGEVTRTVGHYYPIDIAGGINVAKGIPGSTTTVSKEQLIAWNPDTILVARCPLCLGYDASVGGDPVERSVSIIPPMPIGLAGLKIETLLLLFIWLNSSIRINSMIGI
jgi:ABC-type enterochelin transport system substrate-binding protein